MNKALLCVPLLGALLLPLAFGQAPAGASGGRGRGGPAFGSGFQALRSPQVMTDGHVAFRYRNPNAKAVILVPEPGDRVPMIKGDDGVWTVTMGPLQPDVYAYSFTVDGVGMPDPSSGAVMKTGRPNAAGELGASGNWQSQFLVPGNPAEPWELTSIPHGALAHVTFYSKAMEAYRDYYVYTPPAFDPKRSRRYPVLYLQHGAGENAAGWSDIGKANLIMDSLIAAGKSKEMIVVMPLGHPAQPLPAVTDPNAPPPANDFGGRGGAGGGRGGAGGGRGGSGGGRGASGNAGQPVVTPYFTSLLTEIMPQVEKNYNAGNTKATRAIAGLSMGGGQTEQIALLHPELFNYVGMFSPAVGGGRGGTTTLPAALTPAWAKQFKLFWIACGSEDTLVGPSVVAFKAALKQNNVPFTDIVTPGTHSYTVWKRNLVAFAPLLFQ
jgi:enterochelin esterase family protein